MDKKTLAFHNIDDNHGLILDPDNVFWAITRRDNYDNRSLIFRKILTLYDKVKNRLDVELEDFRFSANLSAIYIDPTDRCNANCPYCYVPLKVRKTGRSMTRKELSFILEKIARYFSTANSATRRGGFAYGGKSSKRKCVIVFHASEPLLVKEIIFEAIKEYKDTFNFGLQTNAILLERQDVEFLKEHRAGVGISLDSPDSSVNNRLRLTANLGGNFTKAVSAIEWFDGYEGLNVITTVTKLNVTGLPRMVKFLHSKRVPCVLLNPVRVTQESSRNLKPDKKLLTRYFIKAVKTAIELSKQSKHRIIIGNFANIILGIVAPTARRLMCDISPCGGGRCFLTITASGDMIPCGEFIGFKEFYGGNIFKDSIEKAMQSAPFKKIRSRIVEGIPECDVCPLCNICGAPCPAELSALGSMYQPSIFCEFYKEIIKYAFKLISQGKEKYCLRKSGFDNLEYYYCLKRGRER